MKVLNLGCAQNHLFEGWFASEDDFRSQSAGGLIECPICGDNAVTRLPSAPRLNMAKSREPQATPRAPDAPVEMTMQTAWLQAVRHVMANTVDVGARFAEEARRIHYGEVDMRAIRGQATRDEAIALVEEGIEVMSIPVPPALKGPLQ